MSEEVSNIKDAGATEAVQSTTMETVGYQLSPNAVDLTEAKDGGVMKDILRAGKGDEFPATGDTVFVHYVGTLQSDGTKFDSSRDRDEKFEFSLGEGSVIKAWDIGVATMRRGELAVLVCKPEYAYGEAGSGPKIPPNATLVFEVELFDWRGQDVTEEKDGSILKSILKKGDGYRSPHEMSACKIHVVGRHAGTVFQDEELSIIIGEVFNGAVVPGVEQALQHIKKGERARVKIQSKHAYGAEGNTKYNIPPNADLEYEIELHDFDEPKSSWQMDIKEKLEESEKAKTRGTELFKDGHYKAALQYYKRVVELISNEDTLEGAEGEQRVKLLTAAHLNAAMCNIKLNDFSDVLESCNEVLKLDATSEKGLFRRGLAHLNMKNYEEAVEDFRATLQVEPNNGQARKNLAVALKAIQERKDREKKTYRGMFEKFAKEDKRKEEKVGSVPAGGPSGESGSADDESSNEHGDENNHVQSSIDKPQEVVVDT